VNFQDQDESDRRDDPQPQAEQPAGETGSSAQQPTNGSPPEAEADRPSDPAPSLEQLVLVLRDQLADLRFKIDAFPHGASAGPGAPQVAAIRGELSAHGDQLARLAAGLAEQEEDLARREEALVGRIADLDDDRRASANMLQRGWESYRADVEARVRRGSRKTVIGFVVLALLFLGGLFLVYRQAGLDRAPLAHEVAAMKPALTRGAQGGNLDSLMEGKLKQLAATVRDISDSLKAPAQPQQDLMTALAKERADRSKAEARLTDALHSLEARQRALSARIASAATVTPAEGKTHQTAKSPQGATESSGAGSASADRSPQPAVAQPSAPAAAGPESPTKPLAPKTGTDVAAGHPPLDHPAKGAGAVEGPLVLSNPMYALQLIGFRRFDDVEHFAGRPGMPKTLYYLEKTSNGRPLYLVMHSLHKEVAGAHAAEAALPTDIAGLGPFVRPLPAGTKLWPCQSGKCARVQE